MRHVAVAKEADVPSERLKASPAALAVRRAGPDLVRGDEHTIRTVGVAELVRDEEEAELVGPVVGAEPADQPFAVKIAAGTGVLAVDVAAGVADMRAAAVKRRRHLGHAHDEAAGGTAVARPAGPLLRHLQGEPLDPLLFLLAVAIVVAGFRRHSEISFDRFGFSISWVKEFPAPAGYWP